MFKSQLWQLAQIIVSIPFKLHSEIFFNFYFELYLHCGSYITIMDFAYVKLDAFSSKG